MLASPAAPLVDEMEETARLPPQTPTPVPPPLPAPGAAFGIPGDATGPTRLSPRLPGGTPPSGRVTEAAPPQVTASGAVPPPPPAGAAVGGSGPPGGGAVPAPPAAAAAPARRFPCGILVLVAVLGLLVVGGGVAGILYLRGVWGGRHAATEGEQQAQLEATPAPPAVPATTPPPLPASTSVAPAPEATATVAVVPVAPPPEPTSASPFTKPTTPARDDVHAAPRPTATPAATAPRLEVVPEATHTRAPVPAATPRHVEPPPRPEPPPEPQPAEPAQRYDREMTTTLALKFKVEPEDTVVSFKAEGDRRFTVIGRAEDYDADKRKSQAFDLPGEGIYYLRLYADGREMIYRLDAHPGALPTTIAYVLIPKPSRRF